MSRRSTIVLLWAFLGLLVLAATTRAALFGAKDPPRDHDRGDGHRRVLGRGQVAFDGHGGEWWWNRWHTEHRHVAGLRRRIRRLEANRRTLQSTFTLTPAAAIRFVFGPYADQALRVAQCESGLNTYAQNGQYLGLFQMGSSERARFGHGPTALEQARAAYRYFVVSGRSWGPWSCRP